MNDVSFYHKQYAIRRNRYCYEHISVENKPHCERCKALRNAQHPMLSIFEVGNNPILDMASYLEYEVAELNLSVEEARYRLVQEYPQCNCLPLNNCIPSPSRRDKSVIVLIIPYHDSIRTIPTMNSFHKRRELLYASENV